MLDYERLDVHRAAIEFFEVGFTPLERRLIQLNAQRPKYVGPDVVDRFGGTGAARRGGGQQLPAVYYNGRRIYGDSNRWRSRDFRYLGSVGLFDAVYLDTTERKRNELIFAVSEDFGGWGITAAWSNEPSKASEQ